MLVADVLLVGFLLLTRAESARGVRYFEARRMRFDLYARKVEFIGQHVDWGALIRDTARTTLEAWAHEAATRSLMLVRSTERFLTRAVQTLSVRRATALPGKVNVNVERLKHGIRGKKIIVTDILEKSDRSKEENSTIRQEEK